MGAPELFLVPEEVQELTQLGIICLEQADEEGEQRNVALVADEAVFLKVVNGGVAVAPVLLGPVQVVQVVLDGVQYFLVLVDLLEHAEGVGNVDE